MGELINANLWQLHKGQAEALLDNDAMSSVLTMAGGLLVLLLSILFYFWLASCHSKAAHMTAVIIRVMLDITLCIMAYRIWRDIETGISDADTWTTAGVILMILLGFQLPGIVRAVRRSASRRRATGMAEGRILQIVGETRLDRDGDSGKAYVYLNYSEYVALKGKAYEMSGGSGEAIIKFKYSESGPVLNEVEWSADGDLHDGWLKENFPAEYLKKDKAFEAYDEKGRNVLAMMLQDTVEKAMGVPVEQNDLLSIDTDKETYEIVKVIESGEGENYKFDTETLEKGNLSDL